MTKDIAFKSFLAFHRTVFPTYHKHNKSLIITTRNGWFKIISVLSWSGLVSTGVPLSRVQTYNRPPRDCTDLQVKCAATIYNNLIAYFTDIDIQTKYSSNNFFASFKVELLNYYFHFTSLKTNTNTCSRDLKIINVVRIMSSVVKILERVIVEVYLYSHLGLCDSLFHTIKQNWIKLPKEWIQVEHLGEKPYILELL